MLWFLALTILALVLIPLPLAIMLWSRLRGLEDRLTAVSRRLDAAVAVDLAEREAPPQASPSESPLPDTPEPAASEPVPSTTVPPVRDNPAATLSESPPPYIPQAPTAPAATDDASFEERLGSQWAVYVGGAALALGGLFLVRHAIEAGWLGPAARVILGLLLGAGLVGAAAVMRLRNVSFSIVNKGGAHIPSVLTAAGTIILLGSLYAAHALYGFIGAGAAFVLLGAVGIGTMFLAAIHGPALAGLGLAAAYAVPVLIQTSSPNPWALVVYVTVVGAAAMGLARLRGWLWLVYTALGGAVVWGLALAGQSGMDWELALMAHVLLQSGIAAFIIGIEPHLDRSEENTQPDIPSAIVFGALTALAIVTITTVSSENAMAVPFAIAMLAILAGTAYVSPAAVAASPLATILLVAVLNAWPAADMPIGPEYYFGAPPNLIRLPEAISSFLIFAAVASTALAAIATRALWTRTRLPINTTGLFALGATAAPLLALAIAYLRVTQFGTGVGFSFAGAVLAGLFAVLAGKFLERETITRGLVARIATGAFAAAAIAALSIALVAGLQRGYMTVAFALTALGTAYVSSRKDIPTLRVMSGALGLVVLARIVWDPRIMGTDLGTTPVFNWLLFGYGVPALAFWVASKFLRKRREDFASDTCDALAILFTALLCVFQIRHFVFDGDPLAPGASHLEMGLFAILFLGLSHALMHLATARRTMVHEAAHATATILAGLAVVFGLGIAHNPFFTNEAIGGGVPLSTLVPAYLLPGLMALYIARHAEPHKAAWYVWSAAIAALALIFAYVTLEVRHGFWGEKIGMFKGFTAAEMWVTTVAWLALAIAFLAYGLVRGSLAARGASGLLLAVTVVKVGLFDLSGVTGIWRALSFLCLGAVLIGIGIVYQKWGFGRNDAKTTAAPAGG
jgi:uncharacterized membrane protein